MFKLPKGSPDISTILRVHAEASATFSHPGAILHPKNVSDSELHSAVPRPLPLWDLYHSEALTSSGSSPLRDPPRFEDLCCEPKAPTIDHP